MYRKLFPLGLLLAGLSLSPVSLATSPTSAQTGAQADTARIAPYSVPAPKPIPTPDAGQPTVDLVLALDTSSSMSGLINSAKQRLWDVVNELGQAQPTPILRVAIITFGTPSYGANTGYVKVNQGFTSDLDLVNKTLFSFSTNGGDEYVARAIVTSINQLDWSTSRNSGRILFVAGNESAAQDPAITINEAARLAKEHDIAVNTIFCGNASDTQAQSWASIAQQAGGMYASIDQQAGAVAQIATPMDAPLAKLNQQLNQTYLFYGKKREAAKRNQREQDTNSESMSAGALASRTMTKSGKLYKNNDWDLVDAIKDGLSLDEVAEDELPAELAGKPKAEQAAAVAEATERRAEIQAEIKLLGESRKDYLKEHTPKPVNAPNSLDTVMKQGLEKLAKEQGLTLPAS